MEINKTEYTKINDIIKKYVPSSTSSGKEKQYELEVRVKDVVKIDYYKFENILNNLIFSKENGGYGLSYTMDTTLDIKYDESRLSIIGKDNVKMYWLKERISDEITNYKYITKRNIDMIDLDEYDLRISLSAEDKIKDSTKFEKIISDGSKIKNYRLKNRYYIVTADGQFRFDLTSIKMVDSLSFKKSNIFKAPTMYEIELEYIGNNIVLDNLFKNINTLLSLVHSTTFIIKKSEMNRVLSNYKGMISFSNNHESSFIVVNPVPLVRVQQIKDNYAVTLKADGLRNLLYVLDGKIYFINGSMTVTFTGLTSEWSESIIEGELLTKENLFLAYDMLYVKGKDVRGLPLVSKGGQSRLGYLESFVKSLKSQNNDLTVEMKEYKYDGDIFENIKELWSASNYGYKTDGLIFTPLSEPYPTKVGTWDKLYKWKPANQNSFDFLIKIVKNDAGQDVKSPFIIYKNNGDSDIYQYKTLVLHVGKLEGKKYMPVEFDPPHSDDIENISHAKILLDSNEKMMVDGSEIIDDIIVEFVYDTSRKDFQWQPLRIRHDKTQRYKSGENIFGNNEKTANDIWMSIKNPLTFTELSAGLEYTQNITDDVIVDDSITVIETNILKQIDVSNTEMLHFGNSDITLPFKKLVIIGDTPDESTENVIRIGGDILKLMFPNYDMSQNLKKVIPKKFSFNVVSVGNGINQFFASELTLRILLQNTNDNLMIDGLFIGFGLDSTRITTLMKGKKSVEGNDWKIEKAYNTPIGYGKKVQITYRGIKYEENLISYVNLDKFLVEYGFERISLTALEFKDTEIFHYYNKFVYKKIENTSDNLYKKVYKALSNK